MKIITAIIPIAAAALALSVTAAPTRAQSFNCRYAKLPAEVAICQSPELRALDIREARDHFEWLNAAVTGRSHVIRLQREWLRKRNRCGYDVACLREAYRAKIEEIENGHD